MTQNYSSKSSPYLSQISIILTLYKNLKLTPILTFHTSIHSFIHPSISLLPILLFLTPLYSYNNYY